MCRMGPIQRAFAPVKRIAPPWLWSPVRRLVTAVLAPLMFTIRSGHWKSSLRAAAVSPSNAPLPWYTYSAIDFLSCRTFSTKSVLEFGSGQSTLWWAARAASVVSCEENREWLDRVRRRAPPNVTLHFTRMDSPSTCVADVVATIGDVRYDIIVIDGLYRAELVPVALKHILPDGFIICDNAEGYGFFEAFRNSGLMRVDFVGMAPGVISEHSTSIYFGPACFAVQADLPITLPR